jgi:hypothetical protein
VAVRLELPPRLLRARAEALTRLVLLSIGQWARSGAAFEGAEFDRFFTNLVDMGAAMLTAEVSVETRRAHGI